MKYLRLATHFIKCLQDYELVFINLGSDLRDLMLLCLFVCSLQYALYFVYLGLVVCFSSYAGMKRSILATFGPIFFFHKKII